MKGCLLFNLDDPRIFSNIHFFLFWCAYIALGAPLFFVVLFNFLTKGRVKMSEQTFTQEQVNQVIEEAKKQWEQDILQPVKAERDDLLQYKPKDRTPEELEIERLKGELIQQRTLSILKDAQLEDFAEFINVENEEELRTKISTLSKVLDERKLNNSYVPTDHRQTDAYSQAEKSGNVQQMISAKLSKLFN